MKHIKWSYLIPCLGPAFIWHDQQAVLNRKEENLLFIYHAVLVLISISLALYL
ncbi:hypothetical protein [Robertkochia aurantiaca]|uniref:hypothetical protein n=1 Tax=Robertkochia aurantiaca TaxID=2873700 RepID=UPI001CC998DF|nr:hypothetical protein [Robertkochia sp. 3YJGBD-33]